MSIVTIKTKSYYHKLYKRGMISQSTNNAYRNLINSSTRVAKTNHYRNSLKTSQNYKRKTCSTIKQWQLKKQNSIAKLVKDGYDITEEIRKSEFFNTFLRLVDQNLQVTFHLLQILPCQMFILTKNHLLN